ncbi:hypothetical protein LCGC14_1095520 [marine sediment metagenome]|uniref:Uncharacterized protein n=1 Tax=marine sediment metagenome TaxID=412755 RepID=A0A0F9PU62_9ZZZZ
MLPHRKRRGFQPHRLTSSAPRDTEFLLHRTPYFSESSTDCTTVDSTAEKYKGSVGISMRGMSARDAGKPRLCLATVRCNVTTSSTRLRAVRGRYLDKRAAGPVTFIAQHLDQPTPASIENAAVETGFSADVAAGVCSGPFGATGHIPQLQFLDDHRTVVLGVAIRDLMQVPVPLPANCAVDSGDTASRFLLIGTPFLASGDHALCAGETLKTLLQVRRLWNKSTSGIGDEIDHAAVEGDWVAAWSNRICDNELADDAGKPLVPIAYDAARLRCAFEWSMDHCLEQTEFGEADAAILQSPDFGMRFAQRHRISALALPARLHRKPLKAALPRFVELDEQLRADVPWDISKPWKLSAKPGQLLALVKGRVVSPLAAWTCEAKQPLLMGQVPQIAQRVLPRIKTHDLCYGRIDPIAVGFVNRPHQINVSEFSDTLGLRPGRIT